MDFRKMTALILLCFGLATLCIADELPATAYIDARNVRESSIPYLSLLIDLIETHGDEKDAKKTLAMLMDLKVQSSNLWQGKSLASDRFNLAALLTTKQAAGQLYFMVDRITNLITHTKDHCFRSNLDDFLGIIKVAFRDDLKGFAKEGPPGAHKVKLNTFLLHYGREIMSGQILKALEDSGMYGATAISLEKVIAYDLGPNYTETDLIDKAQKMDLTRDDLEVNSMLEKFDDQEVRRFRHLTPAERLSDLLKRTCNDFSQLYGQEIEIYTWTRLLMPNEAYVPSGIFRKRTELWRVCLPVINEGTFDSVVANIKRNI